MSSSLLSSFPDLGDWNHVSRWANDILMRINENDFSGQHDIQAVTLPDLSKASHENLLGVYESEEWRKFALAVCIADWACYPKPEDKADFARVLSVVSTFPQGFRVYFSSLQDGTPVPVGYTGWYPIFKDTFDRMQKAPETIKHRGSMAPLRELSASGENYLYLFNFSIVEPLVGTPASHQLIKDFAQSLEAVPKKGLASVTVSEHGIRVSEKFGLSCTGQMTHDGDAENVYCGIFSTS